MAAKHAILIGINNTSGMDPLAAAAESAIKMEAWAKSQDFETKLFVDFADKEVKAGDIVDALDEILKSYPQQIVIYFSGHGCSRSAGSEIWFLPKALTRGEEAFDLVESKAKAYQSGVESIVFISDACRTAPNDHKVTMVTGRSIFPHMANRNPATKIDMLYAAWPGDLAHETKGEAGDYSAIYTECLLTCLNGEVEEVIMPVQKLKPNILGVMPHELNEYLMKAIPSLIIDKGLFFQQQPMGEVNSRDPVYLSKIDVAKSPNPNHHFKGVLDKMLPVRETEAIFGSPHVEPLHKKLDRIVRLHDDDGFSAKSEMDVLQTAMVKNARTFFEELSIDLPEDNYAGFAINGDAAFTFYEGELPLSVLPWDFDLEKQNEFNKRRNMRIILPKSSFKRRFETARIFIAVSELSKTGFPIAIIPGFFCIITFKEEQILSVDYFPTDRKKKHIAIHEVVKVAERKAIIIAAARNGFFEGSEETGDYLRRFKNLDPTLGLFAAYAYARSGKFEDIESVYWYVEKDDKAVLFDIELLRSLTVKNFNISSVISDRMPLLTQGWSYLAMLYPNEQLLEVVRMMKPGLWTTFTPEGVNYLIEQFRFKPFK